MQEEKNVTPVEEEKEVIVEVQENDLDKVSGGLDMPWNDAN